MSSLGARDDWDGEGSGGGGSGRGGGGNGGPLRNDRSDRAIDPSDLWRRRDVDRLTDIVVDGDRDREELVDNGSSCAAEVRSGTRLRRPLRMRAISASE